MNFFRDQITRNKAALGRGQIPEGRVCEMGTVFPARELDGIELGIVPAERVAVQPKA